MSSERAVREPSRTARLANEFATVEVSVDGAANGPRLAVTDVRTGRSTFFDPLVLEALVWVDQNEFATFLDPQRRWVSDVTDEVDDVD